MSAAAKRMRDILKSFDYEKDHKFHLKFMILATAFHLLQAIFAMVDQWADMDKRFLAFEDVNVLSLSMIIYTEYTFLPQNVDYLLSIIEEDFYEYRSYKSPKRKELTENEVKSGMIIMKNVELMVLIAICNICLPPIVLAGKTVLLAGGIDHINTGTLPMPLEISSRAGKDYPPIYFAVFASQLVFFAFNLKTAFVFYNSGILAMQRLKAEMKLFTLVVGEVGMLVANRRHGTHGDIVTIPEGYLDLRLFWRELIEHHYCICRNITRLNEGIKLTASAINQMLCLIICVSLYYCVENDNVFSKLKDLSLLVPVLLILLVYCSTGQTIIDEGEKMRDALTDWDWADSPLWQQKTLLLVLTRTNRKFIVKPFGIFSLDLRNAAMVMRAAYSYFNILQYVSINSSN